MSLVRVEPSGVELSLAPGETVFEAAGRLGVVWPTICYGQTRCTACALTILEGHENSDEPDQVETSVLNQLLARRRGWSRRDTRLACRMTARGDVTVEKKGVRPMDHRETDRGDAQ